jgi:FlaA1/EpsC-like NDP-sugar epimerase
MRMLHTNVLTTDRTLRQAIERDVPRYFAVSSDKAANPVSVGTSPRAVQRDPWASRGSSIAP